MTTCLAFDTATKTGVAVGEDRGKPRAWSIDLGRGVWPQRYARTLRLVAACIEQFRPDLVAVEAFVGGPKANSDLIGLVACVQGEATRMGVRVVSYYPASIRAHFLSGIRVGKTPIKSQVYAKCRMLGWEPKDTDCADALALWDYALCKESRAHQMMSVGGVFAR
jgi:Holliday junction resolvasome RuvABC endonuclease subunit